MDIKDMIKNGREEFESVDLDDLEDLRYLINDVYSEREEREYANLVKIARSYVGQLVKRHGDKCIIVNGQELTWNKLYMAIDGLCDFI